jgi:hypothetical protein
MPKTNLQQQITIHALPSKVWKVLTCSEYVNQYFPKENIQCDWTEGSSILLFPEKEKPITIGHVMESVPGLFLKFSFREETTSAIICVTYELIIASNGVELKMKCTGFEATHPEYIIRVQQSNLILQKIKWLAEYS